MENIYANVNLGIREIDMLLSLLDYVGELEPIPDEVEPIYLQTILALNEAKKSLTPVYFVNYYTVTSAGKSLDNTFPFVHLEDAFLNIYEGISDYFMHPEELAGTPLEHLWAASHEIDSLKKLVLFDSASPYHFATQIELTMSPGV